LGAIVGRAVQTNTLKQQRSEIEASYTALHGFAFPSQKRIKKQSDN